jgi:hypothetical protein
MSETERLIQSVRELEESHSEKFTVEDGYIVERHEEGEKKDYLKLIVRLFQPVVSGSLLETVYLPMDQEVAINLATLRSIIERPSILAKGTPADGLMKGPRYKVESDNLDEGHNSYEKWPKIGGTIQSLLPDFIKAEEKV